MEGPGEYLPDVTEGITRVEDLPKPRLVKQSRNFKCRPCPCCDRSAYRDQVVTRTLHDLGDLRANRPVDLKVSHSQHYCSHCDIYFNADMDDLALPKAHYTHRVLDHNPTHEDILRFFKDFRKELDQRGLTLQGITTDGSPLYPVPIRKVFGDTPHQVCEFHVIKELTLAILRAVAQARKRLKASMPVLGRGRPSRKTNKIARCRKRLERRITDLFDRRHLFVKHHLTSSEKNTLRRITRGLPDLRR